MKKLTMKNLEQRILTLESELEHCQNDDTVEPYISFLLLFYITMPIWLPIKIVIFICIKIVDPLLIFSKDAKSDKKNHIRGEYNPLEHIWGRL